MLPARSPYYASRRKSSVPVAPLTAVQRQIATDNLRLANFLLFRHYGFLRRRNYVFWTELRSAAYEGLCFAARRFRADSGAEPTTFIHRTVWGFLKNCARNYARNDRLRGETSPPNFFRARADDRYPAPPEDAAAHELRDTIASALRHLDARDALVVRLRFGLDGYRPHTLAEAAVVLGVSRERVNQLWRNRIRARLRAAILTEA
jgi:RNA polymerase sigma factor (sigma-70 family)